MRPLIRSGEILPIAQVPGGSVGPGDIVLYKLGEITHLHRVWWRRGRTLWIKDDAGTVSLHCIPEDRVLGRLEAKKPLSRGWLGLIYGLTNTALFVFGRKLKTLARRKTRNRRRPKARRGFPPGHFHHRFHI